jgi:hypothetical protein
MLNAASENDLLASQAFQQRNAFPTFQLHVSAVTTSTILSWSAKRAVIIPSGRIMHSPHLPRFYRPGKMKNFKHR